MPSKWLTGITFKEIILSVTEKTCRQCGSNLAICSHREHRIYSLEGAVKLFVNKLIVRAGYVLPVQH